MSAYYNFKIVDDLINEILESEQFNFDNRKNISINIIDTDGEITIDLTELVNVKALYIFSAMPITVKINTQAISFDDFMFMKVIALTSLTIQTAETTAHNVNIIIWGSDT